MLTALELKSRVTYLLISHLCSRKDGHTDVEKYPLNGWKAILESIYKQKELFSGITQTKGRKSIPKLKLDQMKRSLQLTVKLFLQNVHDI